ncbi:MAG: hypothetical protein H0X29_01535 [Parachlamydiaceae bacterium]|nr:hypothetical protein [Parachlamydiaceae bacterium]
MKCWNCGSELPDPAWGKLSFRAMCDNCFASLHSCRNCVHHKPGASNECAIPGTIRIIDRGAANFCEEFKLKGTGPVKTADPSDAARRLFGDEAAEEKDKDPKKRFNSLFGED